MIHNSSYALLSNSNTFLLPEKINKVQDSICDIFCWNNSIQTVNKKLPSTFRLRLEVPIPGPHSISIFPARISSQKLLNYELSYKHLVLNYQLVISITFSYFIGLGYKNNIFHTKFPHHSL